MDKLNSIRRVISDANKELAINPDRLVVFAEKGKVVATGAASLSFEYQYDAKVIIVDYSQHPDSVVIPLIAWIRKYQPELMTNSNRREDALKFEVEIAANDLYDIAITIPVTERVRVWKVEGGLGCEHLPEPEEDPESEFEWKLYLHGEELPWPPALIQIEN